MLAPTHLHVSTRNGFRRIFETTAALRSNVALLMRWNVDGADETRLLVPADKHICSLRVPDRLDFDSCLWALIVGSEQQSSCHSIQLSLSKHDCSQTLIL